MPAHILTSEQKQFQETRCVAATGCQGAWFKISADLDIQLGMVALRKCVHILYCNLYSNFC